MQQYFVDKKVAENIFEITAADIHHIATVMRMKKGDKIRVIFQNTPFLCELSIVEKTKIEATIITEISEIRELSCNVTIALGLLKQDKFDYTLQKLTELGMKKFIPWNAQYSIVKIAEKKADKRKIRWQTIVKEAAEQAKRHMIPEIMDVCDTKNFEQYLKQYDKVFIAYEVFAGDLTQKMLLSKQDKKILIIIGPEGGISENEVAFFQKFANVQFITLGSRILRAETAAIFAMGIVAATCENILITDN